MSTSTPVNLLQGWRDAVARRTDSPWPGLRPLRAGRDDPTALVGRDRDARELTRLVHDTDVVVFTGASGVGKTSMLQLKLLPTLREAGYVVAVCDDWTRNLTKGGVDELLLHQLHSQLPARVRQRCDAGDPLLDTLDELYADRCVIVLDQFEQLIRYQRRAFREVLDWIEEAAARSGIRVVISLRVEYVHELSNRGGLRVGPFQQATYDLPPITTSHHVHEIVDGGNRRWPTPAITKGAVKEIVDDWEAAGNTDTERSLLHLQAVLLILWQRKTGTRITPDAVRRLRTGDALGRRGRTVFDDALPRAVQVCLEACDAACASDDEHSWVGVDPVLAGRTRDAVRALSGHLSSGGYKVDQAREDLARWAILHHGTSRLARSLPRVDRASEELARLVDSSSPRPSPVNGEQPAPVPDWLSTPRHELFREEPIKVDLLSQLDPDEATAGPTLDLRPQDALLEEYRAVHFALEWLRSCELVRISNLESGKSMVTLVHDLFGNGLIEWSTGVVETPPVHQFAAIRGVEVGAPRRDFEVGSTERDDRIEITGPFLANLRWRSCEVRARIRHVTFVNCDFRGTTFKGCLFEGVSFVNCMLDDAEFFKCEIKGSGTPLPPPVRQDLLKVPSFFIEQVPRELVRSLQWYREPRDLSDRADLGLHSTIAGLAAVVSSRDANPNARPFEPQGGGLTIFGGRVSSLAVRDCEFGRNGRMALRHVAGTSVEFADQTGVRLDIEGAALRGLTITKPVTLDEVTPPEHRPSNPKRRNVARPAFEVLVSDTIINNVWFGVGLTGRAVFDDSRVWQVFNAADRHEFEVTATLEAATYGLVNVEPTRPPAGGGLSPSGLGNQRGIVHDASRSIDYRRRPLQPELERLQKLLDSIDGSSATET